VADLDDLNATIDRYVAGLRQREEDLRRYSRTADAAIKAALAEIDDRWRPYRDASPHLQGPGD
jgi:hypothetical protein